MEELEQAAKNSNADAQKHVGETLGDDMQISPERQQQILRDEDIARQVLGLFQLSYDDLIRMDDTSPYGQAVKANPLVIENVLAAENPVIEALKISLQFMPYAEFIGKYGDDPQGIKEALKAEAMEEMKASTAKQQKGAEADALAAVATPFSTPTSSKASTQTTKAHPPLEELFKNR